MNALSWLVGLRYLTARKGSRFVSLFSFASIMGMAVSVLAMVLVLSVMNGFEGEMRKRILHAIPHAQITAHEGIADWQSLAQQLQQQQVVLGVAPQDRARVLLESDNKVRGGELFGIDPVLESGVSQIDQFVTDGEWNALRPGEFGAVLGRSLARQLQVEVGDSINIMLPRVSVTPLGLFPRSRRFTVVGIFSVGAQLDSTQLYVHIDDAGRLLRTGGRVDALRLRFDDVMRAPEELEALRHLPTLADFELKSWRDENRTLFNAIRMEKIMVSLMLSVIVAVAVFNLVSILTMAVADRRNDIAVLRTIGAPRGTILAIFLIYGMAMGVAGIGVGVLLGSVLAGNIGNISAWLERVGGAELMDSSVFFIAHLPSEWRWEQTLAIAAMALGLCVIAVFYPAWRASKIHPAEALRYE
ncbi:MAG TPA: lipoprotein-releasing ABC transporter permease subunit [Pseudomonadales bacterium]|nr:lipoprotein-releasing ABC transporter permease subunit [Pseudomonadales bacterium]